MIVKEKDFDFLELGKKLWRKILHLRHQIPRLLCLRKGYGCDHHYNYSDKEIKNKEKYETSSYSKEEAYLAWWFG